MSQSDSLGPFQVALQHNKYNEIEMMVVSGFSGSHNAESMWWNVLMICVEVL